MNRRGVFALATMLALMIAPSMLLATASQANQGYVTYGVAIFAQGRTVNFTVTESVEPSQNASFSDPQCSHSRGRTRT